MGGPVKADNRKVFVMKMWLQRRREKGLEPNADVIWARIKETWPASTQEQWEAIFQAIK